MANKKEIPSKTQSLQLKSLSLNYHVIIKYPFHLLKINLLKFTLTVKVKTIFKIT
jgi:hypothetical protein